MILLRWDLIRVAIQHICLSLVSLFLAQVAISVVNVADYGDLSPEVLLQLYSQVYVQLEWHP